VGGEGNGGLGCVAVPARACGNAKADFHFAILVGGGHQADQADQLVALQHHPGTVAAGGAHTGGEIAQHGEDFGGFEAAFGRVPFDLWRWFAEQAGEIEVLGGG